MSEHCNDEQITVYPRVDGIVHMLDAHFFDIDALDWIGLTNEEVDAKLLGYADDLKMSVAEVREASYWYEQGRAV